MFTMPPSEKTGQPHDLPQVLVFHIKPLPAGVVFSPVAAWDVPDIQEMERVLGARIVFSLESKNWVYLNSVNRPDHYHFSSCTIDGVVVKDFDVPIISVYSDLAKVEGTLRGGLSERTTYVIDSELQCELRASTPLGASYAVVNSVLWLERSRVIGTFDAKLDFKVAMDKYLNSLTKTMHTEKSPVVFPITAVELGRVHNIPRVRIFNIAPLNDKVEPPSIIRGFVDILDMERVLQDPLERKLMFTIKPGIEARITIKWLDDQHVQKFIEFRDVFVDGTFISGLRVPCNRIISHEIIDREGVYAFTSPNKGYQTWGVPSLSPDFDPDGARGRPTYIPNDEKVFIQNWRTRTVVLSTDSLNVGGAVYYRLRTGLKNVKGIVYLTGSFHELCAEACKRANSSDKTAMNDELKLDGEKILQESLDRFRHPLSFKPSEITTLMVESPKPRVKYKMIISHAVVTPDSAKNVTYAVKPCELSSVDVHARKDGAKYVVLKNVVVRDVYFEQLLLEAGTFCLYYPRGCDSLNHPPK